MNEAYKKAIAILSEVKVEQADPSHGSTAHRRTMGGSQEAKGKRQEYRRREREAGQRQTDKFRPGMPQLAHTDPTPGPSLHETYERLISIFVEDSTSKIEYQKAQREKRKNQTKAEKAKRSQKRYRELMKRAKTEAEKQGWKDDDWIPHFNRIKGRSVVRPRRVTSQDIDDEADRDARDRLISKT